MSDKKQGGVPAGSGWAEDFKALKFGSAGDAQACELLGKHFQGLSNNLSFYLPEGRYKALVRTKLEEAAMFATKAFTHRTDTG